MNLMIIIRGPLGIGESTVAKIVAKNIQSDYISIDKVLEENGLDIVDKKTGSIPEKNFLKVNKLLVSRLDKYSKNNKTVVVDGNFYFKNQIEDLENKYTGRSLVFSLTAPVEVCLQRDRQRQKSLGEEATKAVYKLVSKFSFGTDVDVSKITAEEAARLILSLV